MRYGHALRALTTALLLVLATASAWTHETFTPCPDPPSAPPPGITRTDILSEGFEGSFPPAGWAVIQLGGSTTWERNGSYMHSGAYSACVKHGPEAVLQDEYLVTPALDFSTLASAYLEFHEFQQFWPGFGEHHYIAISTTGQTDPAAFTALVDWTPANHSIEGFGGDPVTLTLNAYAGEPVVYLAFRYYGTNADHWYIDDVRVYKPFGHDLALRSLTPEGEQFADGEALQPAVQVENRGSLAEDFDLQLSIEESGAPVYSESQALHLEPAEILSVAFPDLLASGGRYYHLHAEAQLPSDESPADNSRTAFCDSYTRPHVPLGWFHTNAGCGPCAAPEAAFDDWMPSQGTAVALIRCHTWWPDSLDLLYQQNAAQNRALVPSYGYDYTPHFWVDGVVDMSTTAGEYISACESRKELLSPGVIDLNWRPADSTLVACLDLDEPLDPAGDYRLQVAVTEDSVYYAGGNGHTWHHQALRRVFPIDLSGISVSPVVGVQSFGVPIELASYWQSAHLNATIYLQEQVSRRIWQASTGRLSALTGRLSIDPDVSTVHVAEVCSLRVMIAPSPVPVKGVEVVVDFDESVVELQAIHEGSWVSDSGLQRFFYDYADGGSAHFSMAFLDGTRQTGGELALLELRGLAEGATPLVFTLEKVRDANNTELGYTTSTGDTLFVIEDLTPVAETAAPVSVSLRLLGNRPNPFNPRTLIAYELPAAGRWQVTVYDAQGRRVRTLADGWQLAGSRELRWDGRDEQGTALGSGLYFVRVSGPAGSVSGKLLLLK